jgi:dienelactone hydrolase
MRTSVFGPLLVALVVATQSAAAQERRIELESGGWRLAGDLLLPAGEGPHAAVLLLHKAAGSRAAYVDLAAQLATRGIASFRLDLRAHGESTNLGEFLPEEDMETLELLTGSDVDVAVAIAYLESHPRIDGDRIGVVGSSYSGEVMAEAARATGYVEAYVALSPGSFSEASMDALDSSGAKWLFVNSRDDRHLLWLVAELEARSKTAEIVVIAGSAHATDILEARPDITERVAIWLAYRLR